MNGRIGNVIKAYYAVYVPNPEYMADNILGNKRKRDDLENSKNSHINSKKEVSNSIVNDNSNIFESKKHPGHFYRINPSNGMTEWIS